MREYRDLTEEEQGFVEAFMVHASNVIGTTLSVPTRISYSIGNLTMHMYIEDTDKQPKKK
jgi:hypothetical protein